MAIRYFTFDPANAAADQTISNGNRTVKRTATAPALRNGRSVETIAIGEDCDIYITCDTVGGSPSIGNTIIGLMNGTAVIGASHYTGENANSCGYDSSGSMNRGGAVVDPVTGSGGVHGAAFTTGASIVLRVVRSGSPDTMAVSADGGATFSDPFSIDALGTGNALYVGYTTYYLNDQFTASAAAVAGGTVSTFDMMGV